MLEHLKDGLSVPAAELFDYRASASIAKLRHVTETLLGLSAGFYFCDLCQSSAPFFLR